jgi:hypothetical protein
MSCQLQPLPKAAKALKGRLSAAPQIPVAAAEGCAGARSGPMGAERSLRQRLQDIALPCRSGPWGPSHRSTGRHCGGGYPMFEIVGATKIKRRNVRYHGRTDLY